MHKYKPFHTIRQLSRIYTAQYFLPDLFRSSFILWILLRCISVPIDCGETKSRIAGSSLKNEEKESEVDWLRDMSSSSNDFVIWVGVACGSWSSPLKGDNRFEGDLNEFGFGTVGGGGVCTLAHCRLASASSLSRCAILFCASSSAFSWWDRCLSFLSFFNRWLILRNSTAWENTAPVSLKQSRPIAIS